MTSEVPNFKLKISSALADNHETSEVLIRRKKNIRIDIALTNKETTESNLDRIDLAK